MDRMDRTLTIEEPDQAGIVDFVAHRVSVVVGIVHGKLRIVAMLAHGEHASTWDEHEIEWPLPTPQDPTPEVFVHPIPGTDEGVLCAPCAVKRGLDLSLDEVSVWEYGSGGWISNPGPCVDCGKPTNIVCDHGM